MIANADPNIAEAAQPLTEISTSDRIVGLAVLGLVIFCAIMLGKWLADRRKPYLLRHIPIRRHRISILIPILMMSMWIGMMLIANMAVEHWLLKEAPRQDKDFFLYMSIAAMELVLGIGFLSGAEILFVRGIRGLGFSWRKLCRNIIQAAGIYLVILPLVMAAVLAVEQVGQLIKGQEFGIEQHHGLQVAVSEVGWIRILALAVCFGIITPFFEEILFRGYFQSTMRGYGMGPWMAILSTSILFALIHPNATHWPALLILSIAMGYSYENSGSLIQPITIHGLFNLVSVTFTVASNAQS